MTLKTVLNSLSVFISSVIMYTSLIGVDVPRKLHWTPGETVSSLQSVLEGWKSSKYFFFSSSQVKKNVFYCINSSIFKVLSAPTATEDLWF